MIRLFYCRSDIRMLGIFTMQFPTWLPSINTNKYFTTLTSVNTKMKPILIWGSVKIISRPRKVQLQVHFPVARWRCQLLPASQLPLFVSNLIISWLSVSVGLGGTDLSSLSVVSEASFAQVSVVLFSLTVQKLAVEVSYWTYRFVEMSKAPEVGCWNIFFCPWTNHAYSWKWFFSDELYSDWNYIQTAHLLFSRKHENMWQVSEQHTRKHENVTRFLATQWCSPT